MKQKRLVSMIGMLGVLFGTLFMLIGCPTGQEPQKQQEDQWKPGEKAFFDITYDLTDCTYNGSEGYNNWQLKKQTIKAGAEITLAQDGSESSSGGAWKEEYVKHKAGKQIKGWSKNKDGSTKDYDFGQKIKPTGDMTLYPAVSKYGIGDIIDGKTVIYVRNGTKEKVFCKDKYKEYSVIGTDWRYIAADVDAGKNSQKRQWSSSGKNIITSDAIGGGKENTAKILNEHNDDTDANNAAKYCRKISESSALPSEGEIYLIYDAIRSGKITGVPTSAQEESTYLGPQFGSSIHAYFWTSTQHDKDNTYAVSLYKSDNNSIWGGEKSSKSKTEAAAEKKAAYICPIVYYDDDGKVIK
ncbi:MAG: InlB B-repeat-containing protein [Treponema phagedenis]|uniref:InlB B-repeat-containing protein n=1 Tax=Treponema phagedenis TaxID=162 RepID=UPI003133D052